MPNCTYCGKPAGLFRRYHAECRAQFERATTTIPVFFEKLLDSNLPAERFEQLLNEVAATFHIGRKQLRALSIQGINAMVQAAVAQRLMSLAEEDRILDISGALGFTIDDVPGLDDKLVKISVLRDLSDDDIPARVNVVGPLPFKLERGETVVWIFNKAKGYRPHKSSEPAPPDAVAPLQRDMPDYFAPATLGDRLVETKGLLERIVDLVITTRHVFYVMADESYRKVGFAEIGAFHTYANGFRIVRKTAKGGARSFVVDDPWFAANLIVRLLRSSQHAGPELEAAAADFSHQEDQ